MASQGGMRVPDISGAAGPDAQPADTPRVGWPEVGVAALAAVFLYGLGIAIIWAVPDGAAQLAGIVQFAVSGLAPLGAFAAAVALRIRDVRVFGVRRVGPKWILIALGVGIGVVVLSVAVTAVVISLTGPPSNLQADYQAAASGGALSFIVTLVVGAMVTPLGEELLFRGVLANALSRYGAWIAILGSAAVFAVAHGVNYIMPIAFIVGVAAALLLRKTGSIWPGVIVHAFNNSYSIVIPAILGVVAIQ